MDYKQFKIGDSVLVTHEANSRHGGERGEIKELHITKLPKRVTGKVVGLKRMFFGVREWLSHESEEGYTGHGYLKIEKRCVFWEVKSGMFNKPIYTLPEYMTRTEDCEMPLLYKV